MTITKFEFTDNFRNWRLHETKFSHFNLLVGISGVGKTRILNALEKVCDVGLDTQYANGCKWTLELLFEGKKFSWEAETSMVPEITRKRDEDEKKQISEEPRFLRERIIYEDNVILVDRTEDKFIFQGTQLPKIKNTESAISLLSDEESIAPIYQALSRVTFFDADTTSFLLPFDISAFDKMCDRYSSFEDIRRATDIPILIKAYILQENCPDKFREIVEDYSEIFDTVTDIKLDKLSKFDPSALRGAPPIATDWLVLAIKEEGVNDWVISPRLSSGMLRTLVHLLELAMAAPGAVIVIDEFENSLGVNCLPQLTERFLLRSQELQFILTSHHPYVINNIPSNLWKVVTRQGTTVTVLDKKEIPALNTTSVQEQFVLLMNLKEYEQGLQ